MHFTSRTGLVTLGSALLLAVADPGATAAAAGAGAPLARRQTAPPVASRLSANLRLERPQGPTREVVVRFVREPDADTRSALRAEGVDLDETRLASGAYLARADANGLRALEASTAVEHVDVGDTPLLRPLDAVMTKEVGFDAAARALVTRDGTVLDGRGLKLGDYDADSFVFHPELFHADAGAFPWIDVDGDGTFTPGTDAIDLDRDGHAGDGEVARALHVKLVDLLFKEVQPHAGFDAALDYVFLDTNGNGRRDFGDGFTEDTPGFGEPIFVVDDANGDGVLQPNERLLRLGTSKYAAVWKKGQIYQRGNADHGILAYGRDLLRDPKTAFTPEHGTLIGSVMAGGTTARRYHGVAPEADLWLAVAGPVEGLDWLAKQHLAAVGIPYGSTVVGPLDGSSELEQAVDAIWTSGAFPSVSAGNAAGTKGHAAVELDPQAAKTIHFTVGSTSTIYLSIVVADPHASLALEVAGPDGVFTPVSDSFAAASGMQGASATEVSPRGTTRLAVNLTGSLTAGDYQLKLVLTADARRTVHLYTQTSSGLPAAFAGPDQPGSTLGSPGTADHSFAAPGYVIHEGAEYGAIDPFGALASFSSRGPRIDLAHVLGVAAPVNPVGATMIRTAPNEVAFRAWPGTSNSAPIVAAAAGLLRQLYPSETVSQIAERLTTKARHDDLVTSDVDAWGAGKLDLAAAADLAVSPGDAPRVTIEVPSQAPAGARIHAHLVVEGGGPGLFARWDDDYDGTFDTEWGAVEDRDVDLGDTFPAGIGVEVHDDHGNVVRATAVVAQGDAPPATPASSTTTSGGCSIVQRGTPARGDERGGSLPPALAVVGVLAGLARRRRRSPRG